MRTHAELDQQAGRPACRTAARLVVRRAGRQICSRAGKSSNGEGELLADIQTLAMGSGKGDASCDWQTPILVIEQK